MFEEIAAGQGANLLTAIAVVGVALVALYAVSRLMRARSNATFIRGGRNRQPRLAVLDAAAVDARRRLVLVRRDDVEHLILIGGPTDVVVESRIGTPVADTVELPRKEPQHPQAARTEATRGDDRTSSAAAGRTAATMTAPTAPAQRPVEQPADIERPREPVRADPVVADRLSAPPREPANQSRVAHPVPVSAPAPVPAPVPLPASTAAPEASPRPPMAVVPSRDPVLEPAPDAGQIRDKAIDALDQARARVLVDSESPVAARMADAPVANVNPFSEYEDIAADVAEPAPRAHGAETPRAELPRAEPHRPASPVRVATGPAAAPQQRTSDQVMSDFEAVLEAELAGDLSGFAPGRPTVAPAQPVAVAPHPATAPDAGDNGRTPLDDEMDRLLGDLSRRP